jgi:hypothetical protein
MSKKEIKKESKKDENFKLGLKRFIMEIKNNKKEVIVMAILSALMALSAAGVKLFLGKSIDAVASNMESVKILI